MKAASYNQGNSGHRKALCPGAPQGLSIKIALGFQNLISLILFPHEEVIYVVWDRECII